ncbi:protein preY, mitochondrial [Astyanax mexicanus]|uniref:Protein preY, mitochondrial n=2 Tax=Astyanax mexicanus TaxID=7994 RepID=A0A3B1JR37_ASTMX|nr:protein preY, mitochondrial [Astyanax mexicanus]
MFLISARRLAAHSASLLLNTQRRLSSGLKGDDRSVESVLQLLVCPLSKTPLRYNKETNELINEELGIAYPIIDGIPNMIPQDAKLIKKAEGIEEPTQS